MNDNEPINSGGPPRRSPWNKGKLVGPKPPLRLTFGPFGRSPESPDAR
jgi:hypothetical protein